MNKKSLSTLEKYEKILRVKRYSERTIEIYSHYLNVFLNSFSEDPYHISKKMADDFLLNFSYSSQSQQNQFISSIKKFYEYIIGTKLNSKTSERPRKEKKLPKVIDKDYIIEKINSIENLKHKALLSLTYSVGLRRSEVRNLKIVDIDTNRMLINILNAKGRKDRIVPLTEYMMNLLMYYVEEYDPDTYLFNGQFNLQYSTSSMGMLIKKYLGNEYSMHHLRHSCATHLHESGVDIMKIKSLLGHESINTTEIYTNVSKNTLQQLPLGM